jgi:hypothetical protein
VVIAGLGLCPPLEVSPAARDALRQCQRVFYVDTGPVTEAWLSRLGPTVIGLYSEVYAPGRPRQETYRAVAQRVLAAALEAPPVGFAMSGHPDVGSLATALIRAGARALDLPVQTFPGLSSMDHLYPLLGLDPFVRGLQVAEATDLLLRRRRLAPDQPTLIAQVGNLGRLHYDRRWIEAGLLERLVAQLAASHGATAPVGLAFASPHPLIAPWLSWTTVAELPQRRGDLHPGLTLYLPPVLDRAADPALLARLRPPPREAGA